ncbi:ribonuclease H2 subunit A isoform X4 [Dermacentor albipictus]|uniref:ribonuclease H2 subunit A isoform X4 n=1 Tax=Dermacentor albipictus TaxID=60249 RepID=UPI0031FD14B4
MNLDTFNKNNSKNAIIKSVVPDVTKSEPCMLGVDEAGRGPVLGPMVYGIAYCPLSAESQLKELGFADSKTLTEEKREELLSSVEKSSFLGFMVEVIPPSVISGHMLDVTKYSLNAISHDSAIGLIRQALDDGVQVAKVYVDTVGPPEKYQEKLQALFPDIDVTVAKKADATYPIVSAASICAKVARDHAIQSWEFPEGISVKAEDYGSGYPNVYWCGRPRFSTAKVAAATNVLDASDSIAVRAARASKE